MFLINPTLSWATGKGTATVPIAFAGVKKKQITQVKTSTLSIMQQVLSTKYKGIPLTLGFAQVWLDGSTIGKLQIQAVVRAGQTSLNILS